MPQDAAHIHASVPRATEVEVMAQFNRLGGVITSIECEGNSRTSISGTVSHKRVADFRSWLRTYTDGRGFLSEDQL